MTVPWQIHRKWLSFLKRNIALLWESFRQTSVENFPTGEQCFSLKKTVIFGECNSVMWQQDGYNEHLSPISRHKNKIIKNINKIITQMKCSLRNAEIIVVLIVVFDIEKYVWVKYIKMTIIFIFLSYETTLFY